MLASICASNGCDCLNPGSVEEAFEHSTAVIAGKVISQETVMLSNFTREGSKHYVIISNVRISRMYKGIIKSKYVQIRSMSSDCTYHFRVGSSYIIYALGSDLPVYMGYGDKFLFTSNCTRTRPLDKLEARSLNRLLSNRPTK